MPLEASNRVEVEMPTKLGRIFVGERTWTQSIDCDLAVDQHYLQFQLLPRAPHTHDSRVCFSNRWSADRLEPLGTAFLLPANQEVHIKSHCRRALTLTCVFQTDQIQTWFDGALDWTDAQLARSSDLANPTIHNLLFRLSEEVRTPSFASDTLVELISTEIVIEIARYCLGVEERKSKGGLANWRLQLIDERLAQAGERPSLAELAELCKLSARQLTRAFRISRGCSIGSYIIQSRIDKAKRLLRTDQNVKSIAHALGFNSPSHFYIAFHRATGETPRQYRQRTGINEPALS
jgi:AraC family transcriptional regulator